MVWCEHTIVCRQQTKEGSSYIVSKYAKQQSNAGRFSLFSASTDNAIQPLATTGKHKIDQKRRKALVSKRSLLQGLMLGGYASLFAMREQPANTSNLRLR